MKKYLLKGGVVGLVVTTVALVIMELATTCSGYCPKLSAFLPDIIWIYGSIILGGVLLGILLGFIFAKFRERYYWLKGGLLFIAVVFFSNMFVSIISLKALCIIDNGNNVSCGMFELLNTFILHASFYSISRSLGFSWPIIGLFVIFSIGAFWGWVYGKLKNRNIQG